MLIVKEEQAQQKLRSESRDDTDRQPVIDVREQRTPLSLVEVL
jgi:hypothetical protein